MAHYFIAILAPEDIAQHITGWKNQMLQKYGCRVALRSPAHITLIPPFVMEGEKQEAIQKSLAAFSAGQQDISIGIRDFSHFGTRVIFAAVEENPELDSMRKSLEEWLTRGDLFPVQHSTRPYHPHITIASRDLRKRDFDNAWNDFSHLSYSAQFPAGGISLLLHDGKVWNPVYTAVLRQFRS